MKIDDDEKNKDLQQLFKKNLTIAHKNNYDIKKIAHLLLEENFEKKI